MHPEPTRRRRTVLAALIGLIVALGAAAGAGPALADHCDPDSDPNCGPHTPTGPGPVQPPCTGTVGPVHAWPCPVQQTNDCARAGTSPESCDSVQATVYPTTAGPVTVNGASTAPVNVPVPNVWGATIPQRKLVDGTVCFAKGGNFRECYDIVIGP